MMDTAGARKRPGKYFYIMSLQTENPCYNEAEICAAPRVTPGH